MAHTQFVGDWWSTTLPQDQLHLQITGNKITGWYKPGDGPLSGQQVELVGEFDPDPLSQKQPPDPQHYHQAIGWVVNWDQKINEHALTSWAGQYHHDPDEKPAEEIIALFLKTIEREPVPNDEDKSWYRTEVGQIVYRRTKETSGSAAAVPFPIPS